MQLTDLKRTALITLAGAGAAMAVLPARACLFGSVEFDVDRRAALLPGFLDFLWIVGE